MEFEFPNFAENDIQFFRNLINTLYLFVSLFQQLMFHYQYLHYTIYTSSSIEIGGILVPLKSMKLLMTSKFAHSIIHHQYLHYTIYISGITHYVSKYHSKSLFNAHWNYFDQKVACKFLQSSMKHFKQFLNNTRGSMEFHGTKMQQSIKFHGIPLIFLSRSKVPWNCLEHFPYSRVPWNSMKFQGTFDCPEKSSLEFCGIPWSLKNFIFK